MLPTDPLFWVVASLAVVFSGIAKGGFSGAILAATPLLALVTSPLQAAAIMLPILLIQDVISVWAFRRDWDAWNLKVMILGSIVGIGIAWALAAVVSDAFVRFFLGFIALVFVLNQWFGLSKKAAENIKPTAFSGLFWGTVTGFTSTFAHAGAPPASIHLLPQKLPKMTLIGTFTMLFAAMNAIKVVPFFFLGEFSQQNLLIAAVLMPLAIVANLAGIFIAKRMPEELFYKIAYVLTFVIALELIRSGTLGLLRS